MYYIRNFRPNLSEISFIYLNPSYLGKGEGCERPKPLFGLGPISKAKPKMANTFGLIW